MVRLKKTIVKNGVVKSYSVLCDDSQVESLLKDSRFTIEREETKKEEIKEETNENDFSSNKKRKK